MGADVEVDSGANHSASSWLHVITTNWGALIQRLRHVHARWPRYNHVGQHQTSQPYGEQSRQKRGAEPRLK